MINLYLVSAPVGLVVALKGAALPYADGLDVVALLEVAPEAEVQLRHLGHLERLVPVPDPAAGLVVRDGAEVGRHDGTRSYGLIRKLI